MLLPGALVESMPGMGKLVHNMALVSGENTCINKEVKQTPHHKNARNHNLLTPFIYLLNCSVSKKLYLFDRVGTDGSTKRDRCVYLSRLMATVVVPPGVRA
jgi:hypothetical protein